jgi:hypothetical protein
LKKEILREESKKQVDGEYQGNRIKSQAKIQKKIELSAKTSPKRVEEHLRSLTIVQLSDC